MSAYDQVVKLIGAVSSVVASVTSRGSKGALAVEIVDANGSQIVSLGGAAMITDPFDYIKVTSYDSNTNPLIVEYRLGGASGTLVATLTLTYDIAGNFVSVRKT